MALNTGAVTYEIKVETKNAKEILKGLGLDEKGKIQKFFQNDCYMKMGKYTPGGDRGNLHKRVDLLTDPTEITYNSPYAHYQYIGKMYAMDNGKGAYFAEDYGFWSDPLPKKKHATERDLKHPSGGDSHWAEKMWTVEKDVILKEVEMEIAKLQKE